MPVQKAKELKALLGELKSGLRIIFAEQFRELVIHGSFTASGKGKGASLDVIAFVKLSEEEIEQKKEAVIDLTTDLTIRYGTVLLFIENNSMPSFDQRVIRLTLRKWKERGINLNPKWPS